MYWTFKTSAVQVLYLQDYIGCSEFYSFWPNTRSVIECIQKSQLNFFHSLLLLSLYFSSSSSSSSSYHLKQCFVYLIVCFNNQDSCVCMCMCVCVCLTHTHTQTHCLCESWIAEQCVAVCRSVQGKSSPICRKLREFLSLFGDSRRKLEYLS